MSAAITCQAADPSDWAACQSEDLDQNIPACSRILDEARISPAERVKALNLRAKAYMVRRSFVSASRDFSEIISIEPANIAALTKQGC